VGWDVDINTHFNRRPSPTHLYCYIVDNVKKLPIVNLSIGSFLISRQFDNSYNNIIVRAFLISSNKLPHARKKLNGKNVKKARAPSITFSA